MSGKEKDKKQVSKNDTKADDDKKAVDLSAIEIDINEETVKAKKKKQ